MKWVNWANILWGRGYCSPQPHDESKGMTWHIWYLYFFFEVKLSLTFPGPACFIFFQKTYQSRHHETTPGSLFSSRLSAGELKVQSTAAAESRHDMTASSLLIWTASLVRRWTLFQRHTFVDVQSHSTAIIKPRLLIWKRWRFYHVNVSSKVQSLPFVSLKVNLLCSELRSKIQTNSQM